LQENDIIKNIVSLFGNKVLKKDIIETKELANIVFNNKAKLNALNKIIHPITTAQFQQWCKQQKTKYIIKESALLFETNNYQMLDKIILVQAPVSLRIKRVKKRDNKTESDIKKIMTHQVSNKDIIQKVDYIIRNDEITMLMPKIIQLHKKLSKL